MKMSPHLRLNLSKFVFALVMSISTYWSLSIYGGMHLTEGGVNLFLISLIAGIAGFFIAVVLPQTLQSIALVIVVVLIPLPYFYEAYLLGLGILNIGIGVISGFLYLLICLIFFRK